MDSAGTWYITAFFGWINRFRHCCPEAEAKKKGKYTGRKPIAVDEDAFTEQYRAWKNGETSPKFICKKLGLSHATFYRRVKAYEEKHGIVKTEDN